MKLKLISCEIFYREMCAAVARSPHRVDLHFLPKGLHDLGSEEMLRRLQLAIDEADDPGYDAVLLGYGLCNNGLQGLTARSLPLVVPRAHDCITLFLGGRLRYQDYFEGHPGTYFLTSGWIERGEVDGDLRQLSIQHKMGMDKTYEELVELYGEDNAQFLHEQLCDGTRNYGRFAFIDMGIEPDGRFEAEARRRAEDRGWQYERLEGDMTLIDRLVSGLWDEGEFLAVPPGAHIAAEYEGLVMEAVDGDRVPGENES